MLSLTKRTEYGLIALAYLAQHSERTVCARDLADARHLPVALLMNILKDLSQHGMVVSVRGTKGGYRLGIDPHEVTLYDLIVVLEGPVRMIECVSSEIEEGAEHAECRAADGCTVQGPLKALHHKLLKFFNEVRLSDLILPGQRIDVPLEMLGCRVDGSLP